MLVQTLGKLIRNPMIIALLAGFAASLLGLHLPTPVESAVNLFAVSSGAISWFVIGGTLTGLAFDGVLPKIWPIVVGKLVLHPVCVWLALLLLTGLGFAELNGPLKTAAVFMAATPMMGTYPILAQAYGQEELSAAALLLATLQSFFSISTLLWAFHSLPM